MRHAILATFLAGAAVTACTHRAAERAAPPSDRARLQAKVVSIIPDFGCPAGRAERIHPVFEVFDGSGRSLGLAKEQGGEALVGGAICVGEEFLVEFVPDVAANRDYTGWCVNYTSFMPPFTGFIISAERATAGRLRHDDCRNRVQPPH